jgi:hypothetical protein
VPIAERVLCRLNLLDTWHIVTQHSRYSILIRIEVGRDG